MEKKEYFRAIICALPVLPFIGDIPQPWYTIALIFGMLIVFAAALITVKFLAPTLAALFSAFAYRLRLTWAADRETLVTSVQAILCLIPVALGVLAAAPPAEFYLTLNCDKMAILWDETVGRHFWLRIIAYVCGMASIIVTWRNYNLLHRGTVAFIPALVLFIGNLIVSAAYNSPETFPRVPFPSNKELAFIEDVKSGPNGKKWSQVLSGPYYTWVEELQGQEKENYWLYYNAMRKVSFHHQSNPKYFKGEDLIFALMTLILFVGILYNEGTDDSDNGD